MDQNTVDLRDALQQPDPGPGGQNTQLLQRLVVKVQKGFAIDVVG